MSLRLGQIFGRGKVSLSAKNYLPAGTQAERGGYPHEFTIMKDTAMNVDQFSGAASSIGGRVEEASGAMLNDRGLQADGIGEQIKGAAQSLYGDAKETVRDTYDRVAPVTRDSFGRVVEVARDHSLLAILAAGAVGFALAVAFRNANTPVRGSWSA